MGCELSKLAGSKSRNQGGNDGSSPPPPPPAATDPRLPLTARQKFTVIASWKAVARALEPTGIYMFIRLFEENTELLNMFTKFRDQKTKEQQSSSMELAEHAKTVMSTLDEGIKSLDDMDTFLTYLHEVGASHTKIPGFNRQYFWEKDYQAANIVQNVGPLAVYVAMIENVRRFLARKRHIPRLSTNISLLYRAYLSQRVNYRQQIGEFWKKIEKPFLDAVERTLDDRYSENVENIYKLTIKFIIETLIDGFDKAQSDKAKS